MISLVGMEIENGGVLMKFTQTAFETKGQLHAQEARYPARSPIPPYHCHPKQDERFQIIEGALRFHVDGVDHVVRAGEAIDIAKGSYHWANNPHDEPALAIWETRPALRTAELFYSLAQAGKGRAKPRLTDAAAILREYKDEFQLANPPVLVQRVLFGCLAPFGKLPPTRPKS